MAILKNTDVYESNFLEIPSGTTLERPADPQAGYIRFNTDFNIIEYFNGNNWISDTGKSVETPAKNATVLKKAYPESKSGFYWLNPGGVLNKYYCDMEYDGGGWTLVMQNRSGNGGMPINYNQAINDVVVRGYYNFRLHFNLWVGLKFWEDLGLNGVQFTASEARYLRDTSRHQLRARWAYDGFHKLYAFKNGRMVSMELGTQTPGLVNYHMANEASLTAVDNDQDSSSLNCADYYGGHPWWYVSCWSGSMWGATTTSHADAPYWNSSGDPRNYMAIYLKDE